MTERIHVRDLRTCPDKNDLPTSLADELADLLRKDTIRVIPDGKYEDSEFYKITAPKGLELSVQVNSGGDLHDRQALTHGLSNQEIADKLIISLATAKTHVRNILNKLAVDDRTQAAVHAVRRGLV